MTNLTIPFRNRYNQATTYLQANIELIKKSPYTNYLVRKISPFVPENVKNGNKLTKICFIWCTLNAAELGIRSVCGVKVALFSKELFNERIFSEDLAGFLIYTVCALNIIPGTTSACGVFSYQQASDIRLWGQHVPSRFDCWEGAYKLNHLIIALINKSIETAVYPVELVVAHVVKPILNFSAPILVPAVEFTYNVFANTLYPLLGRIKIPMNDTWIGLGILVTSIAIYKLIQRSRRNPIRQEPTVPPTPLQECPTCHRKYPEASVS